MSNGSQGKDKPMATIYLSHILRKDEPIMAWNGNEWGTSAAHFAAAATLTAHEATLEAWQRSGNHLSSRNIEEMESDPETGGQMETLYVIKRKLRGTFGHFPVFRINGEDHVPDMSLPMAIDRLPRDAVRLTPAQSARLWHSTNPSHTFGDETDYGRLLREAIASIASIAA